MGISVGMGNQGLTGIEPSRFGWGVNTLWGLARKLEIERRARRIHEIKTQRLRDERLIAKERKRKAKSKTE